MADQNSIGVRGEHIFATRITQGNIFNVYFLGDKAPVVDYRDCNEEPPEGSESWLAPYAQKAFDEFLKPHAKLAAFIKEHCPMEIK